MALLVQQDPAASGLLLAALAAAAGGEVLATVAGRSRAAGDRRSRLRELRTSVRELTFFAARGDRDADRGTKRLLIAFTLAGLAGAWAIAKWAPALRGGANVWATLIVGVAIVFAGAGLRAWAIFTLGRFFVREIEILPGQTIVRRGPYRRLRHPSYTGNVLMGFGFGLAFGSWVSALVFGALSLIGVLPRIRAEEETLASAFGPAYTQYEQETARLLPGVW